MNYSNMRRSLAPHARERWEAREQRARAVAAFDAWYAALQSRAAAAAITPDLTALRQRAERAERNAAWWQRAAVLLACASLALLILGRPL